jgi:hypothetical protein
VIYQFKSADFSPKGLDPQLAGERIAELRERGHSTPNDIVEDARADTSVLHVAFTWDDTEAARKHRLTEARHLIQSIVVVREDVPERPQAPAFVSVVVRETEERAYVTTVEAYSDEDYRSQMLAEALSSVSAWRRRYRELSELDRIFGVIEEVQADLGLTA